MMRDAGAKSIEENRADSEKLDRLFYVNFELSSVFYNWFDTRGCIGWWSWIDCMYGPRNDDKDCKDRLI